MWQYNQEDAEGTIFLLYYMPNINKSIKQNHVYINVSKDRYDEISFFQKSDIRDLIDQNNW